MVLKTNIQLAGNTQNFSLKKFEPNQPLQKCIVNQLKLLNFGTVKKGVLCLDEIFS